MATAAAEEQLTTALWTFRGVECRVNLEPLRAAVLQRQLMDSETFEEVAAHCGVSRVTLWRLLDGQPVSVATLRLVSRHLGVPLPDVFAVPDVATLGDDPEAVAQEVAPAPHRQLARALADAVGALCEGQPAPDVCHQLRASLDALELEMMRA